MEDDRPFCFVIMPFLPELNYFYLYVRDHLERRHGVRCERADANVLTIPILDKITASVRAADFVVADCTGRNANVFYELGIAHTLEKPVVLITKDEISQAPSDVRHFEFIKYGLGDHRSFLERLDNAVANVLADRYVDQYREARRLLVDFIRATGLNVDVASLAVFGQRMRTVGPAEAVSTREEKHQMVAFMLPRIVLNGADATVMEKVSEYVERMRSEASHG